MYRLYALHHFSKKRDMHLFVSVVNIMYILRNMLILVFVVVYLIGSLHVVSTTDNMMFDVAPHTDVN